MQFKEIDGMAVIFGTPGLTRIFDVYEVLVDKMSTSAKPIFPILPSVMTAAQEIADFLNKGKTFFPDEVSFGNALCRVYNTPAPSSAEPDLPEVNTAAIRRIITSSNDGYLNPASIQALMDAAGIPRAGESVVKSREDAAKAAARLGFPVVMKVVGPVHKSDVGGVVLNVKDEAGAMAEFESMIKIKDTTSILIQPMLSGIELFAGAKYEPKFGHMILCGMGGIFIEVLKDVAAGLSPLSTDEALSMIRSLKSYKIIQGVRGQKGISEEAFADILVRLSALLQAAPEIVELDFNPLLGKEDMILAVDARIRIERNR
jgi:acetyltransferase